MAIFVPLISGGWINLDLVLALVPADGETYTAVFPGQQGAMQVTRAAVDEAFFGAPEPEPAPRPRAKKRAR